MENKPEHKPEKTAKAKIEPEKTEEKKAEAKAEEKTGKPEEKKAEKAKKPEKKTEAIVRGMNLGISTKHSMAICDVIRGKNMEESVEKLIQVARKEKPIPMKGEIPHRRGMMSGRYPVKASKEFIKLIRNLNANSAVNGLENPYIQTAKADLASRPYRRFGTRRFKRTNVLLIAKERK